MLNWTKVLENCAFFFFAYVCLLWCSKLIDSEYELVCMNWSRLLPSLSSVRMNILFNSRSNYSNSRYGFFYGSVLLDTILLEVVRLMRLLGLSIVFKKPLYSSRQSIEETRKKLSFGLRKEFFFVAQPWLSWECCFYFFFLF